MFMGWSQGVVNASSESEGFSLGGGACVALRARGGSEKVSFLVEAVGGLNFMGGITLEGSRPWALG